MQLILSNLTNDHHRLLPNHAVVDANECIFDAYPSTFYYNTPINPMTSTSPVKLLLATINDMSADITRRLGECMETYGGDAGANLDIVTSRQDVIKTLDDMGSVAAEIVAMIELTTARLHSAQETELQRINDVLRGLNTSDGPTTTNRGANKQAIVVSNFVVARERPTGVITNREHTMGVITTDAIVAREQTAGTTVAPPGWQSGNRPRRTIAAIPPVVGKVELPSDMMRVNITDTCSLNARQVEVFADVEMDGRLYWVNSAGHFAIKLAGVLFHGNIGTIYTDDRTPCKLRECAYPKTCDRGEKCHYYHDPLVFPGSTDVRNYAAGSFMYAGPAYRARGRARQFGSRDKLDADIMNVKSDESSRLRDQVMHDILCALLLKEIVG